ncbi:MAG TPA: hypothetical protein VIH58_01020, partial [Chthoniobacterales bacterium]
MRVSPTSVELLATGKPARKRAASVIGLLGTSTGCAGTGDAWGAGDSERMGVGAWSAGEVSGV